MTDDRTLDALDTRARAAAAGVRAAVADRPVPAFDPDLVRIRLDEPGPRPGRRLPLVAVAAVVIVVLAVVAGTWGDDDGAPTEHAGPGTEPAPTTAAGTAVLSFRPVLADEEVGDETGAAPPCAGAAAPPGDEVLAYRPDPDAPSTSCLTVGPVGFDGTDLSRVEARVGGSTGDEWVVSVSVAPAERARANAVVNACVDAEPTCPTRRLAIVVDGEVLSAPTVEGRDLADAEFLIVVGGPEGLTEDQARQLVARIQGR